MSNSLYEILSRDHENIFHGIERGGPIASLSDIPSKEKVDPYSIYTEKYRTPFYLNVIADKIRGHRHFIIELD